MLPKPNPGDNVSLFFTPEEWEASKTDTISLEEVRDALASINGSLANAVIEEREEASAARETIKLSVVTFSGRSFP